MDAYGLRGTLGPTMIMFGPQPGNEDRLSLLNLVMAGEPRRVPSPSHRRWTKTPDTHSA